MRRRPKLAVLMGLGLFFAALPPVLEIFTDHESPDGIVSEPAAMTLLALLCIWQSPFARLAWPGARGLADFPAEQGAALAHATLRARQATVALAGGIFVWLWLAAILDWPAPTAPKHWFALGWSFLVIAAALPVFLAELLVPAATRDED